MKKYLLSLLFILIFSFPLLAQPPQGINYQAITRNASGESITNQDVSFRISILQTSTEGATVYAETHQAFANQFGLVNLIIGQGVIIEGDFAAIDWATGPFFIKIELDATNTNAYTMMGTSQLLSVPYALYAKNSGNATPWQNDGDHIYYEAGNVGIGTDTPQTNLHLNDGDLRITNGQIDFGHNYRNIRYTSVGNMTFQSPANASIVIDNNNNGTGGHFTVRKDNIDPDQAIELFRVQENGRVGIGTSTPSRMLHLSGGDALIEAPEWADLAIRTTTPGTDAFLVLRTATDDVWANDNYWHIMNKPSINNNLTFAFKDSRKMSLSKDGYLGLGTDLPGSLLEIHGGTRFVVRLDNDGRSKVGNLYSSDDTLALVSFGSVEISIDENNNTTNKVFRVINNGNNELFRVQENGNIGIGTSNPHATAILDASSNSKGFLPPRMSNTQIANIQNPANGLTVFSTTDRHLYVFNTVDYKWKRIAYDTQSINPLFNCGTQFIDPRDGYSYSTVQIGSMCWMKENLKYLPSVVGPGTGSETTPYYYVYDYNGTNVNAAKATANYQNYGTLYNWPASLTACPPGWHLPSDNEWTQLVNYVASQNFPDHPDAINGTGNALKSCRQVDSPLDGACKTTQHPRWNEHSTHYGFDEFGFSALPGGYRDRYGSFYGIGRNGYWWSSTESLSSFASLRLMYYNYGHVHPIDDDMTSGFSVRCLRDID